MIGNTFRERMPQQIIFIGDSSVYVCQCYEYLKKMGLAESIAGIVNTHGKNLGRTICGIGVFSSELIDQYPDAVLIITVARFAGARESLCALGVDDDRVFAWWPSEIYPEEQDGCALEDARMLYDMSDIPTRDILNIEEVLSHGACRIQPVSAYLPFSAVTSYWYDDTINLDDEKEITLCDAGAYDGDTLTEFYERYGSKIKGFYAIEPDRSNFEKLQTIAQKLDATYSRPTFYNVALGDENVVRGLILDGISSHIDQQSEEKVKIRRLDDLDIKVVGKLCIKMDIEGYEMPALKGATQIVKRYKPNLAICIYHLANDIYEIPLFLKEIIDEYRFVIRGGVHKVCYAFAK